MTKEPLAGSGQRVKPASDLGVRVLSAAILAPLVLAAAWLGGWLFSLVAAAASAILISEWSGISRSRPSDVAVAVAAIGLVAAVAAMTAGSPFAAVLLVLVAAIAGQVAARTSDPARLFGLGVVYAGLPGLALVMLRSDPEFGLAAIVWIFVIVWATDIGGYVAGRLLGGPKLAPRISPKKTWAGFLCGIAAAVAASVVSGTAWPPVSTAPIWLAGLLSVVSQLGDLGESAFKRRFGAKDSGHLIPGHGGLMDRVDGLIAVSVVAAALGIARSGAGAAASGLLLW